jgi:hypothetical protein
MSYAGGKSRWISTKLLPACPRMLVGLTNCQPQSLEGLVYFVAEVSTKYD